MSAFGADAPPVVVIGAVRAPDGGLAICRDAAGHVFSLGVGASFNGWTLTSVARDEATFVHDSGTVVLRVTETSSMPVASPAQHQPDPLMPRAPKGKWLDGDGQIIDPPKPKR